MNKSLGIILGIILILTIAHCNTDTNTQLDKAQRRLKQMRELQSKSSNHIITFDNKMFKQYALSYPRPYDLVLYITAPSCKLCDELEPQYQYMAYLYYQQGAITAEKKPTFFVKITYGQDSIPIFKLFNFKTAPNLVVSRPQMAVVSEVQKQNYLQKYKWAISLTDGHVTTHKMLEFTNKRTERDIIYKPTFWTMVTFFSIFIIVAAFGAVAFIYLKPIWTNWIIWLVGSMIIYITCVSGVIYDIIHDVPFVGRDPKTGEALVFSDGNRQQFGAQGFIISVLISFVGFLFIFVFSIIPKMPSQLKKLFGIGALCLIFVMVWWLEDGIAIKGWYNPSFSPPSEYRSGSIAFDQGNNI